MMLVGGKIVLWTHIDVELNVFTTNSKKIKNEMQYDTQQVTLSMIF